MFLSYIKFAGLLTRRILKLRKCEKARWAVLDSEIVKGPVGHRRKKNKNKLFSLVKLRNEMVLEEGSDFKT